MRCRVSAFILLSLCWGTVTVRAGEIHYDDIAYLAELKHPPVRLKVLRRAPVTSSRDQSGILGYLAPGTVVEVLGMGEKEYYASARVSSRVVKGWVDMEALEPPPAELLTKIHAYLEKAQVRREFIHRHEVVADMTRAEVQASLGKPDRIARVHAPDGDAEQWFYTIYKYLPHYTQAADDGGQMRQVVSYRREVTGHRVITFQADKAVEITEEQDKKDAAPSAIVVPAAPMAP